MNDSPGVLTYEKMVAALEELKKPLTIEPHMHIVHPKPYSDKRVRYLYCVECFMRLDKKKL